MSIVDSRRTVLAALAMLGIAAGSGLHAATLEQDEARIEALLRAERVAAVARAADAARAAAAATPVIAEVVAVPATPTANDDWLALPVDHSRTLDFDELGHAIGRRVSITTAGGEREHRGIVKAADARRVTLQVRRAGGAATYSLPRKQVVRIDLR